MLSKEQIKEINKDMLGLGRPETNDGQGYSRSDYTRMKDISMLVLEYTDEETYSSLKIMNRYKNTQLKDLSEEISQTLAEYEKILKEKYQTDDLDEIFKKGLQHRSLQTDYLGPRSAVRVQPYEKREMKLFANDGENLQIKLQEPVKGDFFKGFDIRLYKGQIMNVEGEEVVQIPKEYLALFTEDIAFAGRYGYKPDEELLQLLRSDILFEKQYHAIALEDTGAAYNGLSLYIYYTEDKSIRRALSKIEGVVNVETKNGNLYVLAPKELEEQLKTVCKTDFFRTEPTRDFSSINFTKKHHLANYLSEYYKSKEPPLIFDTNRVNAFKYNIYKINISNPQLTKDLWEMKGQGLSYVEVENGNTYISSKPAMIAFLRETLSKWHIQPEGEVKELFKPISLIPTGRVNSYHYVEYEITANNYELAKRLWNYKGQSVKFVDSRTYPDKIVVSISPYMLPSLVEVCNSLSIDTTPVQGILQKYLQKYGGDPTNNFGGSR